MPVTKLLTTAAAAVIFGTLAIASHAEDIALTPDPSLAGLSHEAATAKRQELMKLNGATLKASGTLSGADAVKAAETLIADFSNLSALFPEGSDQVPGSEALPSIWQEWATFEGYLKQAVVLANQMKAAAEAGDTGAYLSSIKSIGGVCGQCHDKFRAS
jgi:cytochrome c556